MVETITNGMAEIAAQVILDSAREMFGTQPLRGGYSARELQHVKDVSALLNGLEDSFGPPGAHGLAQRFGKTVFRNGLRQLGGKAGFRAMEYRMLPSPKRVAVGLAALADIVARTVNETITVTDDGEHWVWKVEACGDCEPRLGAEPYCFALVGLIQEFATWASGGRFYRVVESECRASGAAACLFLIDKSPLD